MSTASTKKQSIKDDYNFSGTKEIIILLILGIVQFTFLIDYLLIMPLGPYLMAKISIDYKDLSFLISAYTFSVAIAGFLISFYIDKIER